MTVQEAVARTIERFPFEGYMTPGGHPRATYQTVGSAALRHLEPGAKILDFGCGPADKTAVLAALGFECSGFDDLADYWHNLGNNRESILEFARNVGIEFRVADGGPLPFAPRSFDLVMLLDVVEHLHDSPRELLNDLVTLLGDGGLLMITVPNAVNVRKRIDVARGRTNYPPYDSFYWYPGPWRGHVREYVRRDLELMTRFLGLELVELRGCDHILYKLPRIAQTASTRLSRLRAAFAQGHVAAPGAETRRAGRARKELPEAELNKDPGPRDRFSVRLSRPSSV